MLSMRGAQINGRILSLIDRLLAQQLKMNLELVLPVLQKKSLFSFAPKIDLDFLWP